MTDYTLAADPVAFGFSTISTAAAHYPDPGAFALSFPDVSLVRGLTVDLGDFSLRLDRLRSTAMVLPDGRPSIEMTKKWQRHCETIEQSFSALAGAVASIQAAYDAASQAQQAATDASNTAATVEATAVELQATVDDIQSGALPLTSINVGGTIFVNDGGTLRAEA